MKYRILVLILVVLLLGAGGGAWWFLGRNRVASPVPASDAQETAEADTQGDGVAQQVPGPTKQTSSTSPSVPTRRELRANTDAAKIPIYVRVGNGENFSEQTVADYIAAQDPAAEVVSDNSVVAIPDQTAGTGGAAVAAPSSDGSMDPDGDGLTNDQERQLGTNLKRADTDGDGLTDRDEVSHWKTDPLNPDSDGDGYPDGAETKGGYNPNGPGKL